MGYFWRLAQSGNNVAERGRYTQPPIAHDQEGGDSESDQRASHIPGPGTPEPFYYLHRIVLSKGIVMWTKEPSVFIQSLYF
jgi:hypothetical protein